MKEVGIYSGQVNNMNKLKQSFEIVANQIDRLDGRIDNLRTSAQPQYMQITNSTQGDYRNRIGSFPGGSPVGYFVHPLKDICVIAPPKTEIFLVYSRIFLAVAEPMGDAFNPDHYMVCTIGDGGIYPYIEDGEWYYGWETININFQFESDEHIYAYARTHHDNIQLKRNNTELPRPFTIRNNFYNWYDKDLIFETQDVGWDKERLRFEITMLLKIEPIV